MAMITYKLPPMLNSEIVELEAHIAHYDSGTMSEAELRAHRVPFGVYEQRVRGRYMMRIRCAAGIITPRQLRGVAELADRYGSGRLHVTTRQEIQVHDLPLDAVIPVMRTLVALGLTSRGGGGNTVRNITASWDSGIASDEVFDVAPYAVELTTRMIAMPDSWLLPRKFKIAFSNSAADNAYATVNDVGFVATVHNGSPGFRVFVAGGMGRMPQAGYLLHDYINRGEVFEVAEAVKRLFSKYGNRRNKHTARLRFLWHSLGKDRFVALYENERRILGAERHAPLDVRYNPPGAVRRPLPAPPVASAATPEDRAAFSLWKKRHVYAQRQHGLFAVRVPLALGDLSAQQAMELAGFLEPFGDDVMRFTHDQNIALRNIPEEALAAAFQTLSRCVPQYNVPRVVGGAVACAGASTCQLGICLSRGALSATVESLLGSGIDLDAVEDIRLHFSGCSNSCGRHGVAHLGFFGKAGRKDGRAYPAYTVVAGGVIDAQAGTKLAERIGDIAARDVPVFVERFLHRYAAQRNRYASFHDFLEREGREYLRQLLEKYRDVPSFSAAEAYYRDWGADHAFSLDGRRSGECAAGLFDLIDVHLSHMREALKEASTATDSATRQAALITVVVHGARALLATHGQETVDDATLCEMFGRHFIATGIIEERFRPLIEAAAGRAADRIVDLHEEVAAFAKAVEAAYASLDDTLQFHAAPTTPQADERAAAGMGVDRTADLRGVACPMNFVKTKMALAELRQGQLLEVLLDDGEPIDNVPRSVEEEGHTIVARRKASNHWTIVIKKAS